MLEIAQAGFTKYSLVYCDRRNEGDDHKKADRLAFNEAYDFMSLSAYRYQSGITVVLSSQNTDIVLEGMEVYAKKRCPQYF